LFFFRKSKHEFYNIKIIVLEHVRCLLLKKSVTGSAIISHISRKCKQSSILTSIQITIFVLIAKKEGKKIWFENYNKTPKIKSF
jgi:hypothetical protein